MSGSERKLTEGLRETKETEEVQAKAKRLRSVNVCQHRRVRELDVVLEQHQTVTAPGMDSTNREVERFKEMLERVTERLMFSQELALTEISIREQKIKELEIQIAQLNGSLALRITRKIPFGNHVQRLLLSFGV